MTRNLLKLDSFSSDSLGNIKSKLFSNENDPLKLLVNLGNDISKKIYIGV